MLYRRLSVVFTLFLRRSNGFSAYLNSGCFVCYYMKNPSNADITIGKRGVKYLITTNNQFIVHSS